MPNRDKREICCCTFRMEMSVYDFWQSLPRGSKSQLLNDLLWEYMQTVQNEENK